MEDDELPTFRPFTREELAIIDNRILENNLAAKKRQERRDRNIAEFGEGARARKMYEEDSDDGEDEDEACQAPNLKLAQGNDLPRRYANFPLHLANMPVVDIDPYYKDKRTFLVISKSMSIFRFHAGRAFFLLSPFHPIRRVALRVLTHPFFSFVVIMTILTNCYVMILPESE